MTNRQLALAGVASLKRRRTEAVIPPPSGDQAEAGIHEQCGSGGWPKPHLFFWAADLSAAFIPLDLRILFSYTKIAKTVRGNGAPTFFGLA
ncbi:MAG TPA: hypothetical protein VKF84_04990 [Candidatus Sulfotelmatobacter sp.]|nr:hypothetical protein [Candidatus Sulfotelmatobacter sp.]